MTRRFLTRKVFVVPAAVAVGVALLAGLLSFAAPPPPAAAPVQPIRVLFLGDNGHHKPAERARQLLPYLMSRGIEARYTDNADDLNSSTLRDVDVLLIYANTEQITPEQEKALLDYVNRGGGFVPVHCASYCFLNSPKYVELVGAQFKSHGTEVFKSKIVEPGHPAMLGLHEFSSWDETYVHHRHNPDRKVLMVRDEKSGPPEPYTWTREVGNGGRVFYTALGHDERTWGEIGFLRLVENGIRWAARRESTIPAAARAGAPALTYVPSPVPIPFYPPSNTWGVQAPPLKEMQAPMSPQDSMRYLELPDGFRAELFVAEPDVVKVIAMAWDARGRLWVAETVDYPNDMQPPGKGNDRIKICEDTDGDGKADKFTVFADKLSIPTSLCFAGGGLVVSQAPDMLFLQDTDGDDKADVRKVLFSGFGIRDTHAGPSNLRYGYDNWVWGVCGYSGFRGNVGGKDVRFGQALFRFKPDGSALEHVTSLSNNAWGLGFGETGQVFASTANNQHSVFLAVPNRFYESVRGWHGNGSAGIADSEVYHPITEFHRQMDQHGRFTAAAGHALYTARQYPPHYWNRIAFVTEGTGHLVHQNILEPAGSGYVTRDGYNFLASQDEWTAPVIADVGPDGQVWVSDWYNYIFQHNPTPRGYETGKGAAYVTPLRDKKHGRVYRVVYGAAPASQQKRLDNASPEQLVKALSDDNMFWRMAAQRLLVERGKADVVPALAALVKDAKLDAIGNAPAAVHALWAMQGLGAFGAVQSASTQTEAANQAATATDALKHPAPGVRKAALDVMPRDAASTRAILAASVLADADAQVRLAALLALSQMPPDEDAGAAVAQMVRRPENEKDRWIPDAATAAAARHDVGFLKAVLAQARSASREKPLQPQQATNLIPNGSFEDLSGALPAGWAQMNHQGAAEVSVDEAGALSGRRCIRLSADGRGADSSLSVRVKVAPQTSYRLTGQIRTKDLRKNTGMGALLNVHELQGSPRVVTGPVSGTTDWTPVQATFNSGSFKELTINCLLGGWGRSAGTAWFDDIRLEPIAPGAGPVENVLRVVTTHYAQGAPEGSLVATLSALKGADDGISTAVLDGLIAGWPSAPEARLASDSGADEALRALSAALSKDNRSRLATLAQRLGRGDLFAEETRAARQELVTAVGNGSLEPAARLDAARRLLALGDDPANVEAILKQVTPQSPPALASGLTSTIATSRQDAAGGALIKNWRNLPPAARKAAVDVLLRRAAWYAALLDALEKGSVPRADLTTEQAQQLVTVAPDPQLAARAKALLAAGGRVPSAERQKIIDKLMPAADHRGDVAAGKASFEKNCAVCHAFSGTGGRVGPDLTGIGKNPRHDILLNILDPNRSVEGTYQLWIVQTNDGQTISGRLDAESQTTVELLDAAGKQQVIQRKDIKRMVSQPISIMPEGFEQLPPEELSNLLEFVAQPVGTQK
jgi:putative membrane-bound dehydrogenase-like protein